MTFLEMDLSSNSNSTTVEEIKYYNGNGVLLFIDFYIKLGNALA